MYDEWNDELRDLIYKGDLDTAARSTVTASLDGIFGAVNEEKARLVGQIEELTNKHAVAQQAVTDLVLANSGLIAASSTVTPPVEQEEDIVDEIVSDLEALSAALDEV